jgi:hypothetical protein
MSSSTSEPGGPTRQRLETAKQKLSQAVSRQTDRLRGTIDYGARHPGQLSLVAFGAGVGVGMLLLSTARPRRRRLLPALFCSLLAAKQRLRWR